MNDQAEQQFTCATCHAVYRSGFPHCPKDGGPLVPLETDPLEGTTFAGRYLMETCVGEGAMGRVYRARHNRMSGRAFAIKVMFGDLAADPKMRSRFEHEAEASSLLNHKNLVSVVDFGETEDGLLYLVMDFIEGANLADMLEESGPIPEARVVRMLAAIAEGLQHAHDQGLIHRDLKTENIVVVNEGGEETPRVVDFGIAKLQEPVTGEQQLTAQGCVVGTPAYMSPEQACGEPLDIRTDFFSLGLIVYELLAGKKPFDGSPIEVARQNISTDAPPVSLRTPGTVVSPELEALIAKLMAKQKEERPESAIEIVERLEEIYGVEAVHGAARKRRPPRKKREMPADSMLAALSASAERIRSATSETIAAMDKGALGGSNRWVGVVLIVLFLVGGGFGAFKLFTGGSDAEPDAFAAESIAQTDEAVAEVTEDEAEPEDDTEEPELVEPKRRTRRVRKKPRRRTTRTRKKAAPVAEPAPEPAPEPKKKALPPVDSSAFTAKYVAVGGLVDRLAQVKGPHIAKPYSARYIRIDLNASLRLDELRSANMAKLKRLERQIHEKLK